MLNEKDEQPIKIMVASTVYGFQDTLRQICSLLQTYGYDVINSFHGTVFAHPSESNKQNCIDAVEECDIFFGIIRSKYGSGIIDDFSITHYEIKTAIELDKPRWFLTHRDVPFLRNLFGKIKVKDESGISKSLKDFPEILIDKNDYLDNVKVIEMYNHAIMSHLRPEERKNNWVQEFYYEEDVLRYVRSQFSDIQRIRKYVLKKN